MGSKNPAGSPSLGAGNSSSQLSIIRKRKIILRGDGKKTVNRGITMDCERQNSVRFQHITRPTHQDTHQQLTGVSF